MYRVSSPHFNSLVRKNKAPMIERPRDVPLLWRFLAIGSTFILPNIKITNRKRDSHPSAHPWRSGLASQELSAHYCWLHGIFISRKTPIKSGTFLTLRFALFYASFCWWGSGWKRVGLENITEWEGFWNCVFGVKMGQYCYAICRLCWNHKLGEFVCKICGTSFAAVCVVLVGVGANSKKVIFKVMFIKTKFFKMSQIRTEQIVRAKASFLKHIAYRVRLQDAVLGP